MGMGPKNIFSQNYRVLKFENDFKTVVLRNLKSKIDFKIVVCREKQNNKKKNFFS